ncbi:MAG: xylulokinase [Eubacterium sp.]
MGCYVLNGTESLGIEFGSTRIKAILVDKDCNPIASGSHSWENRLENGIWTYHTKDIWTGLQDAYRELNNDCENKFGSKITELSSLGISAMMHGYMPFDKNGNLLVPFRTWRNTITYEAASILTKAFNFNIPQRWSIAHLYQAVLNKESHIKDIDYLTTLEGYVHRMLSGKKVIGIGEASGIFPIDSETNQYDAEMIKIFENLDEVKACGLKLKDILPEILVAGDNAGFLTDEGAKLLDPSGALKGGAVMCPPEGDAGTGMVATNSVTARTGNVSAGTSIFSMIVLDKPLKSVYEEIDMVTTPTGLPVAMVHCNNCCTDLDYWVKLFCEFSQASGISLTKAQIYDLLYNEALKGDADCGGLLSYNYFSGEPVTKTEKGRPLFIRTENCNFNLPNFFRAQIYSALATLKIGMELLENENVKIDRITGHGGLFKTPIVGQRLLAGALNTPVSVMETAGEGGAWGIAILARYAVDGNGEPLEEYLENKIFSKYNSSTISPQPDDALGFAEYMKLYKKGLSVEKKAAESI